MVAKECTQGGKAWGKDQVTRYEGQTRSLRSQVGGGGRFIRRSLRRRKEVAESSGSAGEARIEGRKVLAY